MLNCVLLYKLAVLVENVTWLPDVGSPDRDIMLTVANETSEHVVTQTPYIIYVALHCEQFKDEFAPKNEMKVPASQS